MAHMPAAAHAPMAHHMMLGPFKVRSRPARTQSCYCKPRWRCQDAGAVCVSVIAGAQWCGMADT